MAPSICTSHSSTASTAPASTAAPTPALNPASTSTSGAAGGGAATSAAAVTAPASGPVDWARVRLGVDPAPTMFVATWSDATGFRWDGGALVPYGPLPLLPAAQVLNYGQSIFEGLKAYRCAAGAAAGVDADAGGGRDRVLLFRPGANAERFAAGAVRMAMPPVPPAMFMAALHAVVRANADWVPPASRGSLYLRPLLLGTGPLLGLCPSPSYTFVVYAVPVGSRAKEGRLSALDFLIHDSLHRAAPRGVGSTKAAGNYSPCLAAQAQARAAGCHECIFLDARSDTYLEEGSGCNVFATHGSVLTTPPAAGSILPGVTRASLLSLADALGYGVREAPISVEEAMRADEMFASGTAVVVQPIGSITYKGRRVRFCAHSCRSSSSSPSDLATGPAAAPAAAPAANGAPKAEAREEARPGADSPDECSDGDGGEGGEGSERSASSCGSGSTRSAGGGGGDGVAAAEEPVMSYSYKCNACTSEQRAVLAAAAPPPPPGSLPDGVGPVAQRLYGLLTGIQYGRIQDPFGWMEAVEMEGPTDGPLHLDLLPGVTDEVEAEGEEEGEEGAAAQGGGARRGEGQAKGAAALRARSVFADPNLE